jgi:hypothetical protein
MKQKPKTRKQKPKTLPSEWFKKEFENNLEQCPKATKEVWERWSKEGRTSTDFLAHLELYCSHVAEETGSRRRRREKIVNQRQYVGHIVTFVERKEAVAKQAEDLAGQLIEVATEIERVTEKLRGEGVYFECPLPDVSQVLGLWAECLKTAAERANVYSLRNEPGKMLRMLAILASIGVVKDETLAEDTTFFRELAKLLEVGYAAYGITKDVDYRNLQKIAREAWNRGLEEEQPSQGN